MSEVTFHEKRVIKARGILTSFAAKGKTITYVRLAELLGLPTSGNALGQALSPILSDIVKWCLKTHLPPLSVIVVRKSGTGAGLPGRGFWQAVGIEAADTIELTEREQKEYFEKYSKEVFDFWSIQDLDQPCGIPVRPIGNNWVQMNKFGDRPCFVNAGLGLVADLTGNGVQVTKIKK